MANRNGRRRPTLRAGSYEEEGREDEMADHELVEVTVPRLGESVVEVTVEEWLCGPGQLVEKGDPVARVSTDKVDVDIASEASGQVAELLVEVGATVVVGAPIMRVRPDLGG